MTYKELIRELNRLVSEIEYNLGDSLDDKVSAYSLNQLTTAKLDKIVSWNEL